MTQENTSCLYPDLLRPIDKSGLADLSEKGKANPDAVVTLKAKTVCEGQFRNLTYIRNLAPYVIDEPPHLLGEDTAPNPSEALLAALGACLSVGIHANATARNIALSKLELALEGDINVTAVWGVGDLSEQKRLGLYRNPRQHQRRRRRVARRLAGNHRPCRQMVAGCQYLAQRGRG